MIYVLLGVISHNDMYTPRKLRCVLRLRNLFGYLKHPSTWFCMPSQSLWSDPPIGSVRVRPVHSQSHQSTVYGWSPPYNMRLPIVCSKDISTIWGGFFKWWSHLIREHLELFFLQSGRHFGGNGTSEVQVLRTWDGWPNGVYWIFGRLGKVPEGLAIV